YGRTVTLKQVTPGAFNPATGGYAAGTTAQESVPAVITDFDAHEIGGTLIKVGDKKLVTQVATLTPKVSDAITDRQGSRIERVLETKPGPVYLIHTLHLR